MTKVAPSGWAWRNVGGRREECDREMAEVERG